MAKEVTAKKILKTASKVVKRGWTTGAIARRADGSRCSPYASDAACFCAYGAIDRAVFELTGQTSNAEGDRAEIVLINLVHKETGTSVPSFNDKVAKDADQVAELFKRAAKVA